MTNEHLSAVFEDIYTNDRWTNGSGPGSAPHNVIEYRAFVERFIRENRVATVTDLGCGDWQFSRFIDWSGVSYLGLDVVESLIGHHQETFAGANIEFQLFRDITDLPGGDLLITKEVLQHLPNSVILQYVHEIRKKYRFALITNAIEPLDMANREIEAGDWRPLRLDLEPFNLAGAYVFHYHPRLGSHLWRNGVFLMIGN